MFTAKEIILSQIKPALGCTEPAAIALNGAYLAAYTDLKSKVKLTINTNLMKNAMYVPIPNTGRKFGIKLAFLLGFLCGDTQKGLNIFEDVNEECLKKAESLIDTVVIDVIEGSEIYIKSRIDGYEVITEKYHDFISAVKTPEKEIKFSRKNEKNDIGSVEKWLKEQNFDVLYDLIEKEKDFNFINEAVDMNLKLADVGLKNDCALNIGKSFKQNDVLSKIISLTVSASDARMEGMNFPAMSLVGSGNHGICATLPVWVYGKEKGFQQKDILKAVALSMLITIYVKLFIGRLSPVCGAAFASGCGVAGAIAYLQSAEREISKNAVSFVIQSINGVICDGAKTACSLKVLMGAKSGYESAMFALDGKPVFNDGILEKDITKSIRNLSKISDTMRKVDGTIVEIMKEKVI